MDVLVIALIKNERDYGLGMDVLVIALIKK